MRGRGVFVLIFSLLLLFVYFYLSTRILDGVAFSGTGLVWARAILAVPFALQWIMPVFIWNHKREFPNGLKNVLFWAAYLSMGYFSLLLFSVLSRDILWLGVRAAHGMGFLPAVGRADFYDGAASLVLLGISLLLMGAGLFGALRVPPVKKVEVAIGGLAKGLEGFRIVQLTDLHIDRSIRKDFVKKMVDRVNGLMPDLIVVTGDLVDGKVADLREKVSPLALLSAKEGKYYVTGNHEYYWGAGQWIEEVRSLGITPLLNSHQDIQRDGATLTVAGILDPTAAHFPPHTPSDSKAAVLGAPEGSFRLLLAHQPKSAYGASKEGYHLQLSGHTHGGQFLPWNFLIGLFQPLSRGLYRLDDLWVYVSQGTGFWGPPLRLGAPSEITLLTLRQVS